MWDKMIDIYGEECYVNFDEKIVVYLVSSATKHHFVPEVLEMFCGRIVDRVIKPSMDTYAGSMLDIVEYQGVYAELGRNFINYVWNEIDGVPPEFEIFDVFHAFCAKMGKYHYSDYPIDSQTGISDSWYDIMEFYHEGGYSLE